MLSVCVCVSKCVCGCTLSQWSRCWVLSLQMTLEDFPTRCGMAYSPPRFQNKGLKIKSVLSLSSVKTIKTSVVQLWVSAYRFSMQRTVRMCWVLVILYKIFAFQIWIQTYFKFKGRVHPPFSFTHPEWSHTKFDIMDGKSNDSQVCRFYFHQVCCRDIIIYNQMIERNFLCSNILFQLYMPC